MIIVRAYFIFNRRGLTVLLLIITAVFLICCEVFAAGEIDENAKTNSDRITFIENSGYELLLNEPTVKTVTIPEKFSSVYNNYNDLQREAGYDLSDYKGCKATIYTYSVVPPEDYSGDCVFNMIVYNNRVIGGDVSSPYLNGFMLPIKSE